MQIRKNKEYELDSHDRLWRYIDLHQLLYFINTQSIFFAPLSSFEDPLEGISKQFIVRHKEPDKKNFVHDELLKQQQFIYASCWFLGDNESMAMWETHSNPDSVAIEFNAEKLIDLVLDCAGKYQPRDFPNLSYGKVEYIKLSPVDPQRLDEYNHEFIGFLKDKSYKHEEEFRFIATQSGQTNNEYWGFDLPIGPLTELDFQIISHPKMEKWKHENLGIVLRNFSLEEKLKMSDVLLRT